MKLLFLSFFLVILNLVQAQDVQFALQSNLHLSAPNSYIGYNDEQLLPDETTYSNTKGSFGAGYSFGIAINKSLNTNIYLGLNLNQFNSFDVLLYNYNKNNLYQHLSGKTTQTRLSPTITFLVPTKKLTFLMESSVLIPIKTTTKCTFNEQNSSSDSTRNYEEQYSYNFSFGFGQKVGFEARLNKSFKIKTTLGISLFNLTTKNKSLNSYSVNGTNQLNSLNQYDRETNYQLNINNYSNNSTFNSSYDIHKPKDELRITHQFSTFDISFSLIYEIHKKKRD